MTVTDVALHFSFSNCTGAPFAEGCATYEIQLSQDEFRNVVSLPTLGYCCDGGGTACREASVLRRCSHDCAPGSEANSTGGCDVATKSHALWHARPGIQTYFPTLLANHTGLMPGAVATPLPRAGAWRWRVRGFDRADRPTAWSESIAFAISDDRTPRAPIPRVAPSAETPLFHLEAFTATPAALPAIEKDIPADLRPRVAICFSAREKSEAPNTWAYKHNSTINDTWGGDAEYELLGDFYAPALESDGVGLLVASESGPHWAVDWQNLAEIEWLFQRSAASSDGSALSRNSRRVTRINPTPSPLVGGASASSARATASGSGGSGSGTTSPPSGPRRRPTRSRS